MTETRYVIVLEVDNKRAAAAYAKGVKELEEVMPALLESAASYDAWCKAREEERQRLAEKSGIHYWMGLCGYSSVTLNLQLMENELKAKQKISEAAISPFRMEESDVLKMIGWEDGTAIKGLLQVEKHRKITQAAMEGCK